MCSKLSKNGYFFSYSVTLLLLLFILLFICSGWREKLKNFVVSKETALISAFLESDIINDAN